MNNNRKAIVTKAFKSLDKDKLGYIMLDDIKDSYIASKHPDVTSRRKTEDEILEEFLSTLEFYYNLTVMFKEMIETGCEGRENHIE